jgi:hypothetical protein
VKKMHILLLCFFGLWLIAFPSLALESETLVRQTCTSCHDFARVEQAFEIKNQEAWAATVARMLAKPQAPVVTHVEYGTIVDWLSAQKIEQTFEIKNQKKQPASQDFTQDNQKNKQ